MIQYLKKSFDASIEALNNTVIPAEQVYNSFFSVFTDYKKRIEEARRDKVLLAIEVNTLTEYMRSVCEISAWTYTGVSTNNTSNDISSFFYYMWNVWGETECETAFAESSCGPSHLWNKWKSICERHGISGAAERFYAELSEPNRDLLVRRACEVYDRNRKKK